MKHSGLPFYDMLLLEGLPKSASLPLATVRVRMGVHVKMYEY
jgi:hypothetical protein